MPDLAQVLLIPFVAGFIVQRFLEILDPLTTRLIKDPNTKKIGASVNIRIFHELLKLPNDAKLTGRLDVS